MSIEETYNEKYGNRFVALVNETFAAILEDHDGDSLHCLAKQLVNTTSQVIEIMKTMEVISPEEWKARSN